MSFARSNVSSSLTLPKLSAITEELLDGLERRFGYESLLITAASATALLDHCFDRAPLHMRDFDLVLLAGRPVTREWVSEIGQALSSASLEFLPRHVWPRRRCHPRRPEEPWHAGWGFLFDADGFEVDLSIYHDEEAHDTNGLLDVHRVRVPIHRRRRPLDQVVEQLRSSTSEQALDEGWIEDPWAGYAAWRARSARVVNWPAIRLEPIQCAIRIVRDCVQKLDLDELSSELEMGLVEAIAKGTELDTLHLDTRNLLKVLTDGAAARELHMLEKLGVFRSWLPGLGRSVAETDREQLHELLRIEDPSSPWVSARLLILLRLMSASEQDDLLAAVALPEQEMAATLRQRLRNGR